MLCQRLRHLLRASFFVKPEKSCMQKDADCYRELFLKVNEDLV